MRQTKLGHRSAVVYDEQGGTVGLRWFTILGCVISCAMRVSRLITVYLSDSLHILTKYLTGSDFGEVGVGTALSYTVGHAHT